MINRTVIGMVLFLCCALATAQQSGQTLPQSDTTLVKALRDSSFEYSYSDPDRAIEFTEEAMEISRQLEYKKGIAGAHGDLGYAYTVKGQFETALVHLDQGIDLSRSIGDSLAWVTMLNDKGSIYKSKSEYERALEFYFRSRDLCEEMGLERGIAVTLTNIGLCYFELNEHEQALEFYQQALEINETLDNDASLAIIYNNMGLLHGDIGNFEKAHEYHSKALNIRQELGYTLEIANSLNNIGRLHMQQEEHEIAINYLTRALEMNNGKDQDLSSIIHENLAKLYISTEQLNTALFHAEETLALSKEFGTKLGEKIGYELLAQIYEALGDYENAYLNQQKLTAVKNSILSAEKTQQINELQTKYETAQKEKEIAVLEQERQRQAILRNLFLAGLILVGIIGILVYNRQRIKISKKRVELENTRLKEEQLENDLEIKNRELTNYSLHLVQKNEIMKELKESIAQIKKNGKIGINKKLQKLENTVDYSLNLDDDWKQFQHYFEEVHSGFFDALKREYPDLTPNELRLSALTKLNLSIKETATIMGIAPNSVKTARYRLRKKLDIETEENLTEFMMQLEKENL
ncbi:MAG: tetratricopeptide repeat protein [Balneolaceae bacterium]|nr:tetratricopeptide repeat protein [Balneolaceae bacterium]